MLQHFRPMNDKFICGRTSTRAAWLPASHHERLPNTNPRHRSTRRRMHGRGRRGAAAVELAVVAPLLFLLLFGIIEIGRLLMVQQILTNASREGARRAIVENTTADEVESTVYNYLAETTVPGATVTITPSDPGQAAFGDPVSVTCSVPFVNVGWIPSWFIGDTTLAATSVMSAERPQ